jgi:hypothetical protein
MAKAANDHMLTSRLLLLVLLALGMAAISGCASTSKITESPLELESAPGLSWWRVKFRMEWPEGEDPDFSYHTLLADQAVRPVIEQYGSAMPLWRFHRRARRDGAGHQFSFIYYADDKTHESVKQSVTSDPMVQTLSDRGILLSIHHTRGRAQDNAMVSATSDPSWPGEIQRSWPYFIMGVSQGWLDLIREFREKQGPVPGGNIESTVDYYSRLNRQISDQWRKYGRHAYFHHLNGIFGYLPVYMYETGQWQNF